MSKRVRPRRAVRALRYAVAGAAVAALAAPAAADAAANPFTLDYSNPTNITAYARPTGVVVVGRNFSNPGVIDRVQAGGGEVYMYVNYVEGADNRSSATGSEAALYGGSQTSSAYLMKPTRYNFPNLPMLDLRPGSPWVIHAVEWTRNWFPTTHAKGIFLDVIGDRLWTGAWDQMSASEQSAWTAGAKDLIHRLRAALGPNVILVANNIWENGNPDLNGMAIEHHPFSSASKWAPMLQRSDWTKPVRNLVIGSSTSEAVQWAGRPGVTHVSDQAEYGGPSSPIVGFSPLPGVSGVVSGAAPSAGGQPSVPDSAASNRRKIAIIFRGNRLTNPSFEKLLDPWTSWRGSLRRRASRLAPQGASVAQITYSGPGAQYAVTRPGTKGVTAIAGTRYRARAWVRAGSKNTVGKPVTIYLRERTAGGSLVQEVRGRTVKLTKGFFPLNGSIVPRNSGDRIEIALIQDRARSGNSFQFDAVSMAAAN